MTIAVSGASGLVGSALVARLRENGKEVLPLVRNSSTDVAGVLWNPDTGKIESAKLEGVEAVVHLAGENISTNRWTTAKKQRIRDSRVRGTELLCRALADLEQPPATLIAASAIGYYGDRGDHPCDESTASGSDFLAEVCRDWEAATSS